MTVRTATVIGLAKGMLWMGITCIAFMLFIYLYGWIVGLPWHGHPHSCTITGIVLVFSGGILLAFTPDN